MYSTIHPLGICVRAILEISCAKVLYLSEVGKIPLIFCSVELLCKFIPVCFLDVEAMLVGTMLCEITVLTWIPIGQCCVWGTGVVT